MSDLTIRQHVLDELEFDPRLDAAKIGVAVKDGIVTLMGQVGSYAEKVAAERIAQRVKGVRGLAQELEVRFPANKKTEDDQIAERALKIISWDSTIPSGGIHVKVERGWVTLTGEVEWNYQRMSAENAVRKLSGIVGVTNSITVRPLVDVSDIKLRIESALKRNAEVEADAIKIAVTGGKVTLEGKVHAWYERGIVERAAWAVPGVVTVEDHLKVV